MLAPAAISLCGLPQYFCICLLQLSQNQTAQQTNPATHDITSAPGAADGHEDPLHEETMPVLGDVQVCLKL